MTVTQSLAAQASVVFTVNAGGDSSSLIMATVGYHDGNGAPSVAVFDSGSTSYKIRLTNAGNVTMTGQVGINVILFMPGQ